ncbi:MAG TPA: DUF2934 domain-containing protein [Terriglobia bacterium]|nr:DUF2934 domain-containing protein [Terriglobia bacterium]
MNNQEIERLAYWLWQRRGMPMGSPDEDWFLAEQMVRARYKRAERAMRPMPLFAFGIEKQTY